MESAEVQSPASSPKATVRRPARAGFSVVLGLGLSLLFLWLAFRQVSPLFLAGQLRALRWAWVPPAVGLYFAGHALRGLRSQLILRPHTDISLLRAMNMVLAGYAANNVLPARLGEVVRSVLLARVQGLPVATGLSAVLAERILDGLVIVAILQTVVRARPELPAWAVSAGWLAGGLFILALAVVVTLRAFPAWVGRGLTRLAGHLPGKFAGATDLQFHRVLSGLVFLRPDRSLGAIVVLSVGVWVCEGAMFWLALGAVGLPLDLAAGAYFALAVANLAIVLPSSPGYVGTFHYFCALAIAAFGVPTDQSRVFAVVVHALHYVPVTLWGLAAIYVYGFGLRRLLREVPGGS